MQLTRIQPKAWMVGKDLNSIKMHRLMMRKLKVKQFDLAVLYSRK